MFDKDTFPQGAFPQGAFPQAFIPSIVLPSGQAGFQTPIVGWPRGAANHETFSGFNTPIPGWPRSASSIAVVTDQGGHRSLLAYWIGGATAIPAAPRPRPQPGGGDSRREEWLQRRAQILREDSEFIELLAALIEHGIIH